jgi:ketosteroid isomerase-like protein
VTVEELLAKQEIAEVVLRYARGVDRMDRELVRSCYHDDALERHGSFEGGVEAFLDWSFGLLAKVASTMHYMVSTLVELDGDVAWSETYACARHHDPGGPDRRNLIVGLRYLDRFERRAGGPWLIADRQTVTEWVRRDDPALFWPVPERERTARRDRSDPVYQRR